MSDILQEVIGMVDILKKSPPPKREYSAASAEPGAKKIGKCPACSGEVLDLGQKIGCTCGFLLWKTVASKKLALKDQKALLVHGRTDLISGFTSKAGKKFNAILVLDKAANKLSFDFGNTKNH